MNRASVSDAQTGSARLLRAGVVALWLALAMAFNFTMGVFEGQDEGPHFRLVDRMARERTLLRMDAANVAYTHEVTQPPLYYVVVALAISPFDRSDLEDELFINPRPNDGLGYDHTLEELRFPPHGVILALRVARTISVLLGAGTLLLLGATATLLTGGHRTGTLAMALAGFNPKFVHVFSVVSNDAAVFACAALFMWLAVRALRQEHAITGRALAALGATIGLAMMSKYNGLVLAIPAALVVFAPVAQGHGFVRRTLARAAALGAGFLAVSAPFLAYNTVVYGSPLALDWVATGNLGSLRPAPLDPMLVLQGLPGWLSTYFDTIGNVLVPPAATVLIAAAVFVLGGAGFLARIARAPRDLGAWLVLATAGAGLLGWAAWFARYDQTGNIRLSGAAFPALAVISGTGAAWLLAPMFERVRHHAAHWAVLAIMAGLGASTVWLTILPSYELRPSRVPASIVRQLAKGGGVRFDNGIEILAVNLERNKINSGEEARLTFYWRSVEWQPRAQVMVLEARDPSGATMARMTANPVPRLNTTTWGVRTVYSATHALALTATADTVAQVFVGFYDYEPPNAISRVAGSQRASEPIGEVKVRAGGVPEVAPQRRLDANFGANLRLEGYTLLSDTITLMWRPDREPAANDVIFVHALDAQGSIIGQSDAPPAYAMTLWDAGEQVRETRVVPNLAAAVAMRVGVYEPQTRQRLPAVSGAGAGLPDDVVIVPLRP